MPATGSSKWSRAPPGPGQYTAAVAVDVDVVEDVLFLHIFAHRASTSPTTAPTMARRSRPPPTTCVFQQ